MVCWSVKMSRWSSHKCQLADVQRAADDFIPEYSFKFKFMGWTIVAKKAQSEL